MTGGVQVARFTRWARVGWVRPKAVTQQFKAQPRGVGLRAEGASRHSIGRGGRANPTYVATRNSGMTSQRFTKREKYLRRGLSPVPWRRATLAVSLACDGALDPAPSVAATGAWKVGPRVGGSRSRRPGSTASGEASVMAWDRWPPSVAQGVIAMLRVIPGRSGKPKDGPGRKSPQRGCRKATPGP